MNVRRGSVPVSTLDSHSEHAKSPDEPAHGLLCKSRLSIEINNNFKCCTCTAKGPAAYDVGKGPASSLVNTTDLTVADQKLSIPQIQADRCRTSLNNLMTTSCHSDPISSPDTSCNVRPLPDSHQHPRHNMLCFFKLYSVITFKMSA